MDRVRVKQKYWLIALLSVILPGSGHFLISRWDKAIITLSSFLFHISLAYTLLHMVVIEQPVTVAYLMLVIPYHYFYAIFNSMQTAHHDVQYTLPWKLWFSSFMLILAAMLWLPFDFSYPYKQQLILLYPFLLLTVISLYLLCSMRKKRNGKLYLGRISALLMLVTLVILMMLHQTTPIQWDKWLYVIPIIVVLELVIIILVRFSKEIKSGYAPDIWGIFTTVIFIGCSYIVLQYSDYPSRLLESFHAPLIDNEQLDGERGYRYELPPVKVSAGSMESIQLRHLNGYVKVRSGDVEELTIYPVLYVQTEDEQQAMEVRNSATIDVRFEQGVHIETGLPRYQLNQYPRMNMTIVIPKDQIYMKAADFRVEHGALSISDLVISSKLKVESNTAAIHLDSIIGKSEVKTKRGMIYMNNIVGDIEAESKKGDITIIHSTRAIKAATLNGDLYVKAKHLNGDMGLTATVGNIQLYLPKQASYTLDAKVSFGKITISQYDYDDEKEMKITRGIGIYELNLYASDYILIQ